MIPRPMTNKSEEANQQTNEGLESEPPRGGDAADHRVEVEFDEDDSYGGRIQKDPDPLEAFEFDLGDAFVQWDAWGDCRADDDLWKVVNVRFQYRVTWLFDRDMAPTVEDHRRYVLLSRETFDEREVSERELMRGDWKRVEEAEA